VPVEHVCCDTEAERLSGTIRNVFPEHKRRSHVPENAAPAPRRQRADAQRNSDALLEAAKAVFATSGVDAPAKEIADLAGVGVGTLYRHFPQRADLVVGGQARRIDASAHAAPALLAAHEPGEALAVWLGHYTGFLATKDGLATALHKGEPAFAGLAEHFWYRFGPALGSLLDSAAASGEVRSDVNAKELLTAVASLCLPVPDGGIDYSRRMVALLVDGLRYGAGHAS
jgi:AcrR family transcriptional regulator